MEQSSRVTESRIAYCDFCFTDSLFQEYVAISDYMSKQKTFICIFCVYILAYAAIAYGLIALGATFVWVWIMMLVFALVIPLYLVAITTKKPLWWWTKRQKRSLAALYAEALGMETLGFDSRCRFVYANDMVSLRTQGRTLKALLDRVSWVRQSGDLVVVGMSDGSGSFMLSVGSPYLSHYGAVPAVAFLKSKLEGMDPDELVALLEECAKSPKRPKSRKAAWK